MTREILFRAKRADKNAWAFGGSIHGQGVKKGKMFMLPQSEFYPPDCHSLDGYEVIPETVGQFTGIKDKNGKNIFEGDIVKATMILMHSNPIVKICHVYYDKCCFGINWNGKYISNFCNFHCVEFEIIGNIFDNKELLAKP